MYIVYCKAFNIGRYLIWRFCSRDILAARKLADLPDQRILQTRS